MHRFRGERPGHTGGAVRITGARSSLTDDLRRRQRRYMISMAIRTLCVILAVVLWQESRIIAVIALCGGGLIPYIAVVYANAGRERAPDPPDTFVGSEPPPQRPGPDADIPNQRHEG
jgi:hypothetical protein